MASAQDKKANIDAVRQETEDVEKLVSDFEERLPTKEDIPNLLTQFERIANSVGGISVEMEAKAPRREGMKQTIPYEITAQGSFLSVTEFINELERFKRYLKVSDLKISEQKDGICAAEFTLSTYTFVEENTGGAA